jgi:hypothetical protein
VPIATPRVIHIFVTSLSTNNIVRIVQSVAWGLERLEAEMEEGSSSVLSLSCCVNHQPAKASCTSRWTRYQDSVLLWE